MLRPVVCALALSAVWSTSTLAQRPIHGTVNDFDTGAPIGKLQILHRGKKRLDFDLDGLRQKLPRTSSQNIGQWIVDLVGLTKRNNLASLVHGVSLSLRGSGRLDTRLDTPPISFRHHPGSRIAPA